MKRSHIWVKRPTSRAARPVTAEYPRATHCTGVRLLAWRGNQAPGADGCFDFRNGCVVPRMAQAARRGTSQTVAAMSSTDSVSSQPPSIHWEGQNRLLG